ncbi:imidazole glycerol phosphate synthase cyclase subunit, partial [Pelagibacterales bacterium SAG-MED04]|nr:imidazole glycerol phosphate synthase cyclase subunit [Pelagibacterales bacterium SAG-MED04]
MRKLRIIPRLDIKGENLIKGIQLEGVRVIGNPNIFAKKYYNNGADELLYMDAVASLYGRNNLKELIKKAVKDVFIPITVGGGIRSIEDAYDILRSGADKIAINTAAVIRPNLIKELSNEFGSQSIVVSIEAKQQSKFDWEVYVESGREKTGIKVFDWIKKAESLGAGE